MRSNLLNFTKMQVSSLSQIVWLQLLCVALFPMFFNQININNDLANIIIYFTGLLMLSYLLMRNFAFNDAKYKTKLLFSILPVTPNTIICARGVIIYLFCLITTPLIIFFSIIIHMIKPDMFAVVQPHILPYGLLLYATFMPIEFLIFYMFDARKADIIGALVLFPYMAFAALFYNYLLNTSFWIVVFIIAVIVNIFCYRLSIQLYKNRNL